MLRDGDDLSWYARKAARVLMPEPAATDAALVGRLEQLLLRLRAAGVKGNASTMTFFTRRLPPGCRSCLAGRGTNLYTTGLCTRDCFFCFNQKPRKDELVVHGIGIKAPEQAAEIVERYGLRSVGISGGEPLLFPGRVLSIVRVLRALSRRVRVDLYTNGDRVDRSILRALKQAGLDGIRFDLAARDYDASPVRLALGFLPEVAVEIPAIPRQLERQKRMIEELDDLGVPFLNLHELFVCPENAQRMRAEGHESVEAGHGRLSWRPVPESAEAALELLLHACGRAKTLSVYYCSCGTQDVISRRGLARRQRATRQL